MENSEYYKKFSSFTNYKHTITGLTISVILLLTVSVLLLTHLHSSSPPCSKPNEEAEIIVNAHKQTFKNPYVNSTVPLELQLNMIVRPGTEFHVVGTLLSPDERFFIDLGSSSTSHVNATDIPFHFNPRFRSSLYHRVSKDFIVLCSKIRGDWKHSTDIYPKPFSIQIGKKFHIRILCEEEQYRVSIDKIVIGVFEYRLPINTISNVFITGELELNMVEIITS